MIRLLKRHSLAQVIWICRLLWNPSNSRKAPTLVRKPNSMYPGSGTGVAIASIVGQFLGQGSILKTGLASDLRHAFFEAQPSNRPALEGQFLESYPYAIYQNMYLRHRSCTVAGWEMMSLWRTASKPYPVPMELGQKSLKEAGPGDAWSACITTPFKP